MSTLGNAYLCTAAALAVATAGCTTAFDVHTIRAPDAHFERYRTVAFEVSGRAPSPYQVSPQSLEVQSFVRDQAMRVLMQRGYGGADDRTADLVLRIQCRREIRPTSVAAVPTQVASTANTVDVQSETPVSYVVTLDNEDLEIHEGALVVDAYDRETRRPVWHGFVADEVKSEEIATGCARP